jgi:DNA-directed RNA polymerase specialized sigma24 family protein
MILSGFPRRERECLLMQVDGEMPVKEIARRLKISKKAVERSLTSAKKRLVQFKAFIW